LNVTHRERWLARLGIGVLLFSLSCTAGCTQMKIGGLTVEQAFPDPKAAALARAGCEGDIPRIKQLVAEGVSVEAKGKDDIHPLLWAMECHNHGGVRTLLELGADPNYVYGGHASAIWIAAGEPDVEMLKLLIKHGGDVNRRYEDDNPLIRALVIGTEQGDWKNYYLLLDAGADINQPGQLDNTVAEYAVTLGQMNKISELLERGYSYHLDWLMGLVQNVVVDDAHEADRLRVIEMLEARGAHKREKKIWK
jgi:ankyrin repeat protein